MIFDWTAALDADLSRMWAEGIPNTGIAAAIGCTEHALRRRAVVLGLPSRWKGQWMTNQMQDRLRAMAGTGLTVGQVAEQTGLSWNSARSALRRLGVSLGRRAGVKLTRPAKAKREPRPDRVKHVAAKPAPEPKLAPAPVLPPAPVARIVGIPETAAPYPASGHCCWPVTDNRPWLFCNAPKREGHRNYCPGHAAMATGKGLVAGVEHGADL